MQAKVTIYWQRRYLYRQNKPCITARNYHVQYDGTLRNLLTIIRHTINRRERLKLITIDGKQLQRTANGEYYLVTITGLPEVQKQYPDSYLPVVRAKPDREAAPL